MRLFLIGFMGAGKTAVGERLAHQLGLAFVDLDREVEARAGRTVAEIFGELGEEAFRDLEHRELRRVAARPAVVVATGGGAFTFERNREVIRKAGTSVWLDPPFAVLAARLERPGEEARPLFGDREEAARLHRKRRADYAAADLRIAITGAENAREVAARIRHQLREGGTCDI